MKIGHCHICEKELTNKELCSITPYDQLVACENHRQYALYANIHIAKKIAGVISVYPPEVTKCGICSVELTQTEIDTLDKLNVTITCEKHQEVKSWQQQDLAIAWCKYKEVVNPNADIENKTDNNNFRDWHRNEMANK